MGCIQQLTDDVINKIAAGEVVERPASVVKELVENALDAGAKTITVSLQMGGTRAISVSDDGSGMSVEDATLALRRHATSKIRVADDLFRVGTMGFRGEALASIAAISRFSLSTSLGGGTGVRLTVGDDERVTVIPWNGDQGTTVSVENLFYNVPARARFLKAPGTEFSHCLELMQALALCNPYVTFRLIQNNRDQFFAAAVPCHPAGGLIGEGPLRERARAVLGKDASTLLYAVSGSRFGDFEALVSPPGVERAHGRHVYLFVNRRWVKDKLLRYGVLRGYHTHLLKGRFPVAVCHLTTDPSLIDVNVHPAKSEVRFQYPSEIQNLVSTGVRDTLRQGAWAAGPSIPVFASNIVSEKIAPTASDGLAAAARLQDLPSGAVGTDPTGLVYGSAVARRAAFDGGRGVRAGASAMAPIIDREGLAAALGQFDVGRDGMTADRAVPSPLIIPWGELTYLGAFARCYLLFADASRLLVVDQHAFHERILFERLTRDSSLMGTSERLLVPEAIELSPTEISHLRERSVALSERGFAFAIEGETTLVAQAVPALLARRDLVELFGDLARDLDGDELASGREPSDSNAELGRLVLATIACHGAVRAGEVLPENELRQLLAEARTVDFVHNCPHGRRVLCWWSLRDVSQWFDR